MNKRFRRHKSPAQYRSPLFQLVTCYEESQVELWSLDECHIQQHRTRYWMWVVPEVKDPVLLHAPTRKSVACFDAVSLRNGTFVHSMCMHFNTVTFKVFLS